MPFGPRRRFEFPTERYRGRLPNPLRFVRRLDLFNQKQIGPGVRKAAALLGVRWLVSNPGRVLLDVRQQLLSYRARKNGQALAALDSPKGAVAVPVINRAHQFLDVLQVHVLGVCSSQALEGVALDVVVPDELDGAGQGPAMLLDFIRLRVSPEIVFDPRSLCSL